MSTYIKKKKQVNLPHLPSEIIFTNLLSRLPVRALMRFKCVRKSWLDLIENDEQFAKSHFLNNFVPGLAVYTLASKNDPLGLGSCKIIEFEEKLDAAVHGRNRRLKSSLVTEFSIHLRGMILCSVNGLLLLCGLSTLAYNQLCICNPITREYIEVNCTGDVCSDTFWANNAYGFGVSNMSGQYKLVRIFCDNPIVLSNIFVFKHFECEVYTLGTGKWRGHVSLSPLFITATYTKAGAFVNGKLYWLVQGNTLKRTVSISCFDLETELFSSFDSPICSINQLFFTYSSELCCLDDCLCLCDSFSYEETVIWLWKENGEERAWTKEFVIRKSKITSMDFLGGGVVSPLKILKDGEILLAKVGCVLIYYSDKDKTVRRVDESRRRRRTGKEEAIISFTVLHTSSFVHLSTSFERERVLLF